MERSKFWSRVGHWLRAPDRTGGDGMTGLSELETISKPRSQVLGDVEHAADGSSVSVAQREIEKERLEEAYSRIIDLIASIRQHLELQDQRAERMAPTVEKLAQGLANIPEAARMQAELLAGITRKLETGADQAKRIEGLLSQLPHIADAQRETMVSVARQLDTVVETGGKQSAALEECRSALSGLADLTSGSTAAITQMNAESTTRNEQLARLMITQTRRFTFFAIASMVLAAVAIVLGLLALRG